MEEENIYGTCNDYDDVPLKADIHRPPAFGFSRAPAPDPSFRKSAENDPQKSTDKIVGGSVSPEPYYGTAEDPGGVGPSLPPRLAVAQPLLQVSSSQNFFTNKVRGRRSF